MTESTAFAYAGARMQARYGERLTPSSWNHLGRIADFDHLVETLRGTALAPWVAELTASAGPHRIESRLRERFRHEVDEVADWMPRAWHDAVAWFRWAPDLPLLAHVRYRRPAWPWMADDPVARVLVAGRGGDSRALAELLAFAAGVDDERPIVDHWLDAWRARWPRSGRGDALSAARARVRALIDRRRVEAGDRAALEPAFRRSFRRHARDPAGAFAYLALLHIQFTRLREILLRRRLFEPTD